MSLTRSSSALPDWDGISFVVFDVDGTLYKQRSLRLRMARDVLLYTLLRGDLNVISVLTKYRRLRERLGSAEVPDFEPILIAQTALGTANSAAAVRAIVSEWIEQRPLCYLHDCLYPGLSELFAGLRRKGKAIGVLSDYPVEPKLAALGLSADHVVSATDEGVGVLKPHPRGLELLISAAGAKAHQTMLIGDRADRDGLAAQRAGALALIRSSRPMEAWRTFKSFDDPVFAPLLEG
jgi:FMN phosphatase YigB (HAD superfamily)